MENRRVFISFAVAFSVIFSCVYLMLFSALEKQTIEQKTLYMLQVGLFDEKQNAEKMQSKLNKDEIKSYVWNKNKQFVVICGVSEQKKETKKVEDTLKEKNMSYVEKKVMIKDKNLISLMKEKEYGKVLEKIKDES